MFFLVAHFEFCLVFVVDIQKLIKMKKYTGKIVVANKKKVNLSPFIRLLPKVLSMTE